jgi:hypothetical protein
MRTSLDKTPNSAYCPRTFCSKGIAHRTPWMVQEERKNERETTGSYLERNECTFQTP